MKKRECHLCEKKEKKEECFKYIKILCINKNEEKEWREFLLCNVCNDFINKIEGE